MKKITLILIIGLSFLTIGFGQSQNNFEVIQKDEYKQIADSLIVDTIFSRLEMQNKKYNWAMDKGRENEQSINAINQNLKELSTQIDELQNNQSGEINRLAGIVQTNKENIDKTAEELGVKIDENEDALTQKVENIDQTANKWSNYWIIGLIAVALLAVVLYILLHKQMIKQKEGMDNNIQDARKTIESNLKTLEEEGVKLDNRLIELIEKQLEIITEERISKSSDKEPDHSLVLKVADRLIGMEKNLSRMDEKTKGLKQLKNGVKNIKDNFAANGYEIVEMIGKPYNEGMKVSANFIPDEDLDAGQQIITRIIKPQVNYKGVMIQSAQIEVSIGE